MRLALGSSRNRILRALFTEAVMISLAGGAAGMWASSAFLHWLSDWQPLADFPVHVAVNPNAIVYAVALLLSVTAGLFKTTGKIAVELAVRKLNHKSDTDQNSASGLEVFMRLSF